MGKPNFHFRIFPAKFIVEVLKIPESERGQWVMDLATDLIDDNASKSKTSYAKKIITETNEYRDKFKKAGKLGGLAKASNAIASLENAIANPSNPLPNSSSSNSNNKTLDQYEEASLRMKDNIIKFFPAIESLYAFEFEKWREYRKSKKPVLDLSLNLMDWMKRAAGKIPKDEEVNDLDSETTSERRARMQQ